MMGTTLYTSQTDKFKRPLHELDLLGARTGHALRAALGVSEVAIEVPSLHGLHVRSRLLLPCADQRPPAG